MIDADFPLDLFMIGVIFGVAAFVWAGWAQERPPKGVVWRIVLAVISLGGAALAGISVPAAVQSWPGPTAMVVGSPAFIVYVVVFWLEVIAIILLAIWATRRKRKDLIAPIVLAVVGIHFIPLAWVFGQPILVVTGVVVTVIAVVVARASERAAARSFWCGLLGGSILLVVGAVCAAVGFGALAGA
ncbi:hypothetical protein ACFPJ2_13630 [Microbacterium suwonense]|uniref:hypothetical protein n=1 Tax=Microbacterium suwonense TaxID=683047 RepID=UPI003613DCFE